MENQTPEMRLKFIEEKIDRILIYLFGDSKLDKNSTGTIGMIRQEVASIRLELLEETKSITDDMKTLTKRIDTVEEQSDEMGRTIYKRDFKTHIIWGLLGITTGMVFDYLLTLMIRK